MADEKKSGLGGIGEGIRTGIGVLNAFREALEETFQEAVERGDLSPERAKRAMQDAAQRLQASMEDAKERLDFVPRREFDDLRAEVGELRDRIQRLESAPPSADASPGGFIITD